MYKIMNEVKSLGSTYKGAFVQQEYMSASMNADFIRFENGKFINGINNDMLTKVYQTIAQWNKEGLLSNSRDEFKNGKVGMVVIDAFGLKKTGYWQGMNPSDIGFVRLPDFDSSKKAVTSALFRGWGIVKGAKNPVPAGIFLRHYLDINNYDMSSSFISQEAGTFFLQLTGKPSNQKSYHIMQGTNLFLSDFKSLTNIAFSDPAQVKQQIDSKSNVIKKTISDIDAYIDDLVKANS